MSFNRLLITFIFIGLSTVLSFGETRINGFFGPIHIYSETALVEAGFPGSGTEDDPYRIADISVKSEASRVAAIIIENTKSFITISSCSIESAYTGIMIKNAAEGTVTIKNNDIDSIYGSGSGINFINTKACLIEENTCTGFYTGVNLNTASKNRIINNIITESLICGINLVASSKNNITANTIQDAPEGGISTEPYSRSNIIKNNRFLF